MIAELQLGPGSFPLEDRLPGLGAGDFDFCVRAAAFRDLPFSPNPPSSAPRGELAEWLRSGLQIRVHRFDSGTRLQ